MGIIMMPTFDIRRYSELPFSSTLNGSCTNVCPVKINIHKQIYAWREVMEEKHQISYLYGWNRVSPVLHWLAGIVVAVSGVLSAVFAVWANSWQQPI
jgi:L-lactate utilization protein LutB